MDAPAGTFLMYSAGAGETALDRLPGNDPDKEHSIYTRKLLALMRTPGLPLHDLAHQLRSEVHDLAATVSHVPAAGVLRWVDWQVLFGRRQCVEQLPSAKTVSSLPAVKTVQPPEQRAETSDLAFVSEYVRELGVNESTRARREGA
jgi:hypothetical protein